MGLGPLPRGVDAGVLEEQHGVRSGAGGYLGVDGTLQIPRRLVVEVFATQPKIDELQCHGAESNVVATMTGGPLRRLQKLAAEPRQGFGRRFASDEGGESGGLPVRVQSAKLVERSSSSAVIDGSVAQASRPHWYPDNRGLAGR
jgi:hypothetical protein